MAELAPGQSAAAVSTRVTAETYQAAIASLGESMDPDIAASRPVYVVTVYAPHAAGRVPEGVTAAPSQVYTMVYDAVSGVGIETIVGEDAFKSGAPKGA